MLTYVTEYESTCEGGTGDVLLHTTNVPDIQYSIHAVADICIAVHEIIFQNHTSSCLSKQYMEYDIKMYHI